MSAPTPNEVLPAVPCSRNLRMRTGIFMGLEPPEVLLIAGATIAAILLVRVGVFRVPPLLVLLGVPGCGFFFVFFFKKGKQTNYFTIWLRHHFVHPRAGWRAPKTGRHCFPIHRDS